MDIFIKLLCFDNIFNKHVWIETRVVRLCSFYVLVVKVDNDLCTSADVVLYIYSYSI